MNNCGKRFHREAAKFRFLNELIKVLIPKVLLITSDTRFSGGSVFTHNTLNYLEYIIKQNWMNCVKEKMS